MGLFSRVLHGEKSISRTKSTKAVEGTVKNVGQNIKGTPRSITDGGFRGEQKRSQMLQNQISDISMTASKAYDQIDDLKTKNEMLMEQVKQHKQMIQQLTVELDGANNKIKETDEENEQLNRKLVEMEESQVSEDQSLSDSNNNMSIVTRSTPETSLSTSPDSSSELRQNSRLGSVDMRFDTTKRTNIVVMQQKETIENQREEIDRLRERVAELESDTGKYYNDYKRSITTLESSMITIKANRKFLCDNMEILGTVKEPYQPRPKVYMRNLSGYDGKERGETYIVPSLSPFPETVC